jgi:hypothetical protein
MRWLYQGFKDTIKQNEERLGVDWGSRLTATTVAEGHALEKIVATSSATPRGEKYCFICSVMHRGGAIVIFNTPAEAEPGTPAEAEPGVTMTTGIFEI